MLEDPQEEQESELTIMPPLFWVAIIFLAFGVLSGCAKDPFEARVCYVELIGKTDGVVFVESQVCMTPETYRESQK